MPVPHAVIDLLNALLEAQQSSEFRFMGEGSPYLGRASVEVRNALDYIARADLRRAGELHALIEQLGGSVGIPTPQPEGQYLAYLSLRFLLPRLLEAKAILAQRVRNALSALAVLDAHGRAVGSATDLLKRHLSEHAGEAVLLQQNVEDVAAAAQGTP
jgi:hypothetical protein